MARPSKQLSGQGGAKMSEYIKKVGAIIMSGGTYTDSNIETGETEEKNIPGYAGNPQSRVYKYIINTILDFEGINPKFDDTIIRQTASGLTKMGSGSDPTVTGALKILGIDDKTLGGTGMTPIQAYSKAIAKWTSENEEKVLSKEFEDRILSNQEILFYLKHNISSPTGSGRLKDERLKSAHGVGSVEEIHDSAQRIRPLIKKINALMKAELMRKNPSMTSDNVVDQDTFNITYILYNIESYIALKKAIDGILGVDFEKVGKFNITDAETIRTLNDQLENPLPEMALLSLASFETNDEGNTFLHTMYEDFEDFIEDCIFR
jgi:hypothetical protein